MRTLLFPLALAACVAETEPLDCDASAAVSVSVTLTDPDGLDIPESSSPEVTWSSADGGGPCDGIGDTWLCGYEVAGDLTIEATAHAYEGASQVVTVPQGACHVEGQAVTLVLTPYDCTDEIVPAVIVTVRNTAGAVVSDAEVGYCPVEMDCAAPEPCEQDGDLWRCAEEETGALGIDVWATGYVAQYHEVIVEDDGCHPITETLDVVLDPS